MICNCEIERRREVRERQRERTKKGRSAVIKDTSCSKTGSIQKFFCLRVFIGLTGVSQGVINAGIASF